MISPYTEPDVSSDRRPAFSIPSSVLYRHVDEQMVLLNLESEQYYGLDKVGAHVLTRITEEPFEEAMASLETDYKVDGDRLRRDVANLVEALIAAGLLDRATVA